MRKRAIYFYTLSLRTRSLLKYPKFNSSIAYIDNNLSCLLVNFFSPSHCLLKHHCFCRCLSLSLYNVCWLPCLFIMCVCSYMYVSFFVCLLIYVSFWCEFAHLCLFIMCVCSSMSLYYVWFAHHRLFIMFVSSSLSFFLCLLAYLCLFIISGLHISSPSLSYDLSLSYGISLPHKYACLLKSVSLPTLCLLISSVSPVFCFSVCISGFVSSNACLCAIYFCLFFISLLLTVYHCLSMCLLGFDICICHSFFISP